jgi:hypothetical protein
MNLTPFTLDEANEIAEDFEDLIDTDFSVSKTLVFMVDNVVVSPFNEADKMAFAENYHRTKDKTESLALYEGDEYDVILIAYAEDEITFSYIDIRTFTEQRGIQYSFPGAA